MRVRRSLPGAMQSDAWWFANPIYRGGT
ncbi:hypothetical protein ACCAA_550057 [Candidatus Accumulibacter aalborgensis]|uniref:Uncharacterized protein n=1 Tax=Candidatus Accumulibacter aalborgensis TaxID=1860102 RepID=A0A1A8XUI7_9PROT|nr:hypothetical protein ACCAA_550057 [Candidatus Accumulibacter aalborgensis]